LVADAGRSAVARTGQWIFYENIISGQLLESGSNWRHTMKLRKAAVAGTFYQGSASGLKSQIDSFIDREAEQKNILGAVAPHAGYVYSGIVAGAVYSRMERADTFLILGPNHTGLGAEVALFPEGAWELPSGKVAVNRDLAETLLTTSRYFQADELAHLSEHSIEVQVPFLQYLFQGFEILPICLGRLSLQKCLNIGHALAGAIKQYGKRVKIIASSDMSHYVSRDTAEKKDRLALDAIEARNPRDLYETVMKHGISMCGVIPTVCMLAACNELGARTASLVKYATSGDVTGDNRQVVAYAGVIVT